MQSYRINSKTHEDELVQGIASADIVMYAVGPNILKFITPVIAKLSNGRPPQPQPGQP